MRKTAVYILLAAVILSAAATPASAAPGSLSNFTKSGEYVSGQFSDVSPGAWYEPNVGLGYELGLINGKTETLFDPDGFITLAETVKLAASLHGIYHTGRSELQNGTDAWYSTYVAYALENGVLEYEYKDYTAAALRSDFAAILAGALPAEALTPVNYVPDGVIPDVDVAYTYGPSVYALYRAGVLTGSDSGAFLPNAKIKRSESAAIITRMADPSLRVTSSQTVRQLTAEEIAEKCGPAVFYIEVYNAAGTLKGTGSGFFISSSGMAITNYHVVENARSAVITTSDGSEYDVAGIYDIDAENDLALLQIDGEDFDFLSIGDSDSLRNGAQIYAIGSPLGLQNTISPGIISNVSRVINEMQFIQITAPLSPGSSGGALIDVYGNVIGVTAGTLDNGQGLNLAVPVKLADGLSRERYSDMGYFVQEVSEFYENYGNVPDFGYHFGVERDYEEIDEDAESAEYWYDTSELPGGGVAAVLEYGSLLRQNGFRLVRALSESSDGLRYSGAHYFNYGAGIDVYCGIITADDLECVIIEIYS
ncbi:MAG: trypsin-like peptidase domain-containing protein [Oscillospiraceae bacterium]|jgi:hypothetical protein|nr:trypsin-like peptidase domain-containing protein [Oscillospiraceae bacterium]